MGTWPCIVKRGSHRPTIVLLCPYQLLHPAGAVEFCGVVVETTTGPCLEIGRIDGCHSIAVPIILGVIVVFRRNCHVADHRDVFVVEACGQPNARLI